MADQVHHGCGDVFTPHFGVTLARPVSDKPAAKEAQAPPPDSLEEAIRKAQGRV